MEKTLKSILTILILLFILPGITFGAEEITLNNIKRPQSAILFIVDGMGSSYYYPEFTPHALDGSELSKAVTHNLTFRTRIIDIKTPYPSTGPAHSVLVTGFSEANEDTVGYPDATIYDVARQRGFVNLAIMEKGDFMSMRKEQDIIMFEENNSVDEPKVSIQAERAPAGMYELMYDWKVRLPVYLNNLSGREKYSAYNRWAIDAASAVAAYMAKNYPSQRFLLTVNVGAVDSGGHNLGEDDYFRLIEDLDRDIYPLYRAARENNIALFITADHGMSFAVKNARRGGHASEKFSSREESLRIPLVIISQNVIPGVINGRYRQEDIAPTLLSVLDLPDRLQYSDGEPIKVKNYATIFIKANTEYRVSLWSAGEKVSENSGPELIFAGLPLNANYTLKAAGANGMYEERMFLDSDKQFNLDSRNGSSSRRFIAVILMLVISATGLIFIRRIKD